MDAFCGSPFWDYNLSWNTTDPSLTPCFQKTALVWIPCSYLWLFTPLEIAFIRRYQKRPLKWNTLNLSKTIFMIILMTTQIVDFSYILNKNINEAKVYPVYFYTPIIKFCTFILCFFLTILGFKKGKHTSGVLIIFWFMFTLSSSVKFISLIKEAVKTHSISQLIPFITYCIFYVSLFGELISSSISDVSPSIKEAHIRENRSPEETASFWSKISFGWFDRFMWQGLRQPITYEGLWNLKDSVKTNSVCELFDPEWKNELDKSKSTFDRLGRSTSREALLPVEIEPNSSASVIKALWKSFGISFIASTVLCTMGDFTILLSPIILKQLIGFVESHDPFWHGIFYVILLGIVGIIDSILFNEHTDLVNNLALRMNSALMSAVYKKALKSSNSLKRTSTVGEFINLMSVDIERMSETLIYIPIVFTFPIKISIAVYLMWNLMGVSALIGLSVFFVLIPINTFIARQIEKMQVLIMELKDKRINITNEVLSGIKVIKLYAWELSFNDKISLIRKEELSIMKKMFWLNSFEWFLSNSSTLLISIITFATYILIDETHVLTATIAFVSVSLVKIIEEPLGYLTEMIQAIIQMRISIKRLNRYMSVEELDEDQIERTADENRITIESGIFTWQLDDEPTLKNIELTVPQGSLVAVVGPVGSGKSSLLMAILGEMEKLEGKINVYGSIAYVPQIAWIRNATLKENVVFVGVSEENKYNIVIDACALRPDLDILPAGDLTEIGEKGINLSGGQKQRVSLARAVYKNADIYLLDDPLSAVDSHVGKHIFDNVIGPQSLLKNKTRILVTHGLMHLSEVDFIIMLDAGKIVEQGSYQELLEKNGLFSELLKRSQKENKKDTGDLSFYKGPSSRGNIQRQISSLSPDDSSSSAENYPSGENEAGNLITAETILTGKVGWQVYHYYFVSIGKCTLFIILILFIIEWGSTTVSGFWLSLWSNDPPSSSTQLRDIRLGVYGALVGTHAIFMFASYIVSQISLLRASRSLHDDMLLRILRSPMTFFDVTPLGRIINRFSHDIDTLDFVLPDLIMSVLDEIFELIGVVVIICISIPLVAAALFPIAILDFLLQKCYISTSRQLKRISSNYRSPVYSHFSETLNGLISIRAFKMQKDFIEEFNKKIDVNHKIVYISYVAERWLCIRLEWFGSLVIFFTALFAVMKKDSIDSGILGLSVSYASSIIGTFNQMAKLISQLQTHIVSVERIKEYKEVPSEFVWKLDSDIVHNDWPKEGKINFVNYSTRYREGLDLALKDVNCEIQSGEKIGVVGRTGAGKSTLTLALLRLIEPAEGKILIDGVDIAELGLHNIRARLTIIPQDPVLFFGTLRMNLDPFNQFSDQQLWNALEHSYLKDFVSGLEEGLLHPVIEGGENLSVGQRQLICLARALLRKSKILILDEATAAVDFETDELIQKTIRREFADCTVLTIAHRLNTIMDSTRVLVLQNGQVMEFESPENLLQNPHSIFYSMVKDSGMI